MLLGGFAGIIVSLPNMPDWAWRVPFLIGFLSCAIGFYIRFALSETAEYQALLGQQRVASTPIKTLLQDHRTSLLKTFLFAALIGIFIYICNIWWVTYVIERGYFNPLAARTLATSAQAGVVILTPIMGWIAQRWQASKVMSLGLLGTLITAPLLLLLAGTMSFHSMLLVELLYALSLAALTAPMLKYLANLFPTAVRYSGQAIGWNMAVAVFGGTAPLVAQLLSSQPTLIGLVGYIVIGGTITVYINRFFIKA
jgi:MHS family proline/betaine transporter-like MFS transporter